MSLCQWLQGGASLVRQQGQMPPTMRSIASGVFEVGDRVLITLPTLIVVRGTIMEVSIEFPGLFQVLPDYAESTIDTLFIDASQLKFEGGQTLLATGVDAASLEASGLASTVEISPGDTGQVVVTGFGLGLLASVPVIRTLWGDNLVPTGVIISGINGDGFNKFVVNWEVPVVTGTVSGAQAQMGAIFLVIVVILGVLATLGLLGWLITRVDLLLNGSPGTPPIPLVAGTPAPPKSVGITVGPDGKVLTPGQPVPEGSYILGTPGTQGIAAPFSPGLFLAAILALVAVNTLRRPDG